MKKLLTLFTLLLTVCSGAWADDVIISYTVLSTDTNLGNTGWTSDKTASGTIGGTCAFFYESNKGTFTTDEHNGDEPCYNLNGGSASIKLTLTGSNKFKTGDKVSVTFASTGNSARACKVRKGYKSSTNELTSGNTAANTTKVTKTVELTSSFNDLATIYVERAGSGINIFSVSVSRASTELTIATQPVSASYVTDAAATALTVVAQAGKSPYTYQWYSCADTEKTSPSALTSDAEIAKGSQTASYTPSTTATGYYYCKVTDAASASVESNVATITVSDPVAPTISISASETDVTAGTSITLTATADGLPSPTLKWYVSDSNDTSAGSEITGETAETYTFDAIAGTKYYYAKAFNSEAPSGVASNVVTITAAARTGCTLTKAYYDNGFFGEITQPTTEPAANGTIKVYYLSTESEPSISAVAISAGATYDVSGSVLTVTAEDGTTTADYDITMTAVTPYSGTGEITFDGTETWVRDNYGFGTESGKEGWKMIQPSTEQRIYSGNTRMTLFLAPSTSVTLTSGSSNDRYLNIYRNTTKLSSDVKLANSSGTLIVNGDETNPYILVIEQNRTGGDAAVKKVTITKTGFESGIITASGWNTFSSNSKLDLSTITNGSTAYVATSTSGSDVTLTKTTAIVEAEEGLMIKGNANEAFKIATTTNEATFKGNNLLEGLPNGGTVPVAGEGFNYVFGWTNPAEPGFYLVNGDTPTLGANKAYLHTTTALSGKLNIIIDDSTSQEEETDGIKAVSTKVENGVRYNLAGQKVGADYKGIVIVNGKKMLNK